MLVVLAVVVSAFVGTPPAPEGVVLHARRAKRFQELRKIGDAGVEKTAAWADRIVERLDSAAAQGEVNELIAACGAETRDLDAIDAMIGVLPASGEVFPGDYRLVWARSDDAIGAIGTGLHRVPLARMEELFVSLEEGGDIVLTEVVRVIGPFPNVKNLLFGTYKTKKKSRVLAVTYARGIDGTGKDISGRARDTTFRLVYASPGALVLDAGDADWLVFEKQPNLNLELERLRVRPNDDDPPATAAAAAAA